MVISTSRSTSARVSRRIVAKGMRHRLHGYSAAPKMVRQLSGNPTSMISLCQEGNSSQPDVIHSLHGGASLVSSESAASLSSAFGACPKIDSFVITAALLYPAFRSLYLEASVTQSLTPLDSLLFNIVLATLAIGLPILVVLSIRFLWDRNLNLGRSKELEKLIWQLHRIASAMEHQMSLSFPAVQPGTEEPRDVAYLEQLATQRTAAAPSVPTLSAAAAAPTPASDQPTVQQPVTPAAQQASLPELERRASSSEAPRAGVNSMFGL